jgi:hypothetical protein
MNLSNWSITTLLAASLVACASDPCGRSSPCPNDVPATQAQREQCRATFQANASSACYAEAVALSNCSVDNIVCGGDGRTDAALTATRAQNNCTNQRANYVACCTRSPTSTACM